MDGLLLKKSKAQKKHVFNLIKENKTMTGGAAVSLLQDLQYGKKCLFENYYFRWVWLNSRQI